MSRRRLLMNSGLHSKGVINGAIQDDWKTFIEICQKGMAAKYYQLGNTISLNLGSEGIIPMEIIAFDTDTRADGGIASVTLFCKKLLKTKIKFSLTNATNPYASSNLANHLQNVVLPLVPTEIRSAILSTGRDSGNYSLWALSQNEMYGIYAECLGTNDKRIRETQDGEPSWWWLRDYYDTKNQRLVKPDGSIDKGLYYSTIGVAFGFCI